MKSGFKNTDEYISHFPQEIQEKLQNLRNLILKQNPDIQEYIGYQMPAFKFLGKPLVYFAAYKNHIGFYPTSSGIANFENEFVKHGFKFSKGAVQFPIDQDLPEKLIENIIKFRISEILKNHKSK